MTKKRTNPSASKGADAGVKKADEAPAFRPFGALKAMRDELVAKEAKATPAVPNRAGPRRPSSTRPGPSGSAPSPEDEALALYRMMNGVTPLADKGGKRVPRSMAEVPKSELARRKAEAEAPVRKEEEAVHAHLRALVEGGRFEVQDDGRRVEGRRHGVTPDIARKLRRGNFPIDARIDLHGESAGAAPKALERFLAEQRRKGERCVLVIHGKGAHSPGQVGILRGEMAAWLSQGAPSAHVAAFVTAAEADGGEGAVYVLLTR